MSSPPPSAEGFPWPSWPVGRLPPEIHQEEASDEDPSMKLLGLLVELQSCQGIGIGRGEGYAACGYLLAPGVLAVQFV